MASAEPNVEGAVKVLVDILTANGFTKTRSPYETNFRGLVDAILDLKEGFPTFSPADRIGFNATVFENVTEGDALFMRTADGQVGKPVQLMVLWKMLLLWGLLILVLLLTEL